jgi:D-alanyl-D-alanine carboxypeptidase
MTTLRKPKTFFIAIPLGILVILIAAIALYLNDFVNSRAANLAGVIQADPSTAAVAAYTIDEHGELVDDGQSIFLNADTPLVVGSVMKTVVLAAYEQAAVTGQLDAQERVPLADVEAYYLPATDGDAHRQGLASLGIKTDSAGFAQDPAAALTLDDIARIMIHYSGNAETDYLLARLGRERVAQTLQAAGLAHHPPLQSILGITLVMFAHDQPLWTAAERQPIADAFSAGDFSAAASLEDRYLHDSHWRAAQIAYVQSEAFRADAAQMDWNDQLAGSQFFPQATAREYAGLMAKIAAGQLISPEVSARMQAKLESIPTDWLLRLLFHTRYGAKDGVTAGVLALASYAVPKSGPLAGRTRVVVIITNRLALETWLAQLNNQAIYLLQSQLAQGEGAFKALAAGALSP